METILYLISNLFHIYAVYQGSNVFFQKTRERRLYEYIAYAGYYLINSFLFLIFQNGILNILSNLIPFFLITLLYRSSWAQRILATCSIYAVSMVVDIGVTAITQHFQMDSVFFSSGMVSSLLFLMLTRPLLHFHMFSKNTALSTHMICIGTTMFVPIASIVVGHFIAKTLNYHSMIASILLLAINFCVFTLYDQMIRMLESQHTAELIEQQNLAYQAQLELVQQSQSRLRCLRHDLKNHLMQMRYLVEKKNLPALQEYLNAADSFFDTGEWKAYTQHEAINCILNHKLTPVRQNGTKLNVQIQLSDSPNFSVFDMNVILSNLLDNAIEAVACLPQGKQKQIDLYMHEEKGILRLIIGNSFDGVLPDSGTTRKKNKSNHGVGLESVKAIVKKHNGSMQTTVKDHWYETALLLYDTNSQNKG